MRFLVLNVLLDPFHILIVNGKGGIGALPLEKHARLEDTRHQMGRISFNLLCQIRDGNGGWKLDQCMNMVIDAAHRERRALQFSAFDRNRGKNRFPDIIRQKGQPVPG